MRGSFGLGFQDGSDGFFDFFVPDFPRSPRSRLVPQRVHTAANETVSPVTDGGWRGPGCCRNSGVAHALEAFKNNPCAEHQTAVLAAFYDLFQLVSLAF